MSQESVLKILKKNRGWMTSKEIAKRARIIEHTVSHNLNDLFKQNLVNRKFINLNYHWGYLWRIK